ncbi:hypothetical protein LUZ60_005478 [Juncus effusus]|nr:hypothetical protein LUZ60_005478 [Juncus effusus]
MASNEPPSWAEIYGEGGIGDRDAAAPKKEAKMEKKKSSLNSNSSNALANVKSMAYTGFTKAKVVAVLGAQKVKSGSMTGIKWVKEKYQKKGGAK